MAPERGPDPGDPRPRPGPRILVPTLYGSSPGPAGRHCPRPHVFGRELLAPDTLGYVASFLFHDQRIAYTEFGAGLAALTSEGTRGKTARRTTAAKRPVILVHGLLLSQKMHRPLAEELAARGNRAITVDLLGHGESDRPRDMWRYSMHSFGEQLVALMDHLEIAEAVVMGTSLGANTSLELAARAPERLRGMIVEMPVLDNALLASALTFTPILVALTFGEPVMKLVARVTRAVPRGLLPYYGNVVLDLVRQEPGPGGALIQGLYFGRIAPHRNERREFEMPALVLGHRRDPVHPFSDAGMLAEELPNARLIEADSLVELRLHPERLTEEIANFLDEVWAEKPRRRATKPA
jgi:pimeloyl-ACP methyl ester carboxylesterase